MYRLKMARRMLNFHRKNIGFELRGDPVAGAFVDSEKINGIGLNRQFYVAVLPTVFIPAARKFDRRVVPFKSVRQGVGSEVLIVKSHRS